MLVRPSSTQRTSVSDPTLMEYRTLEMTPRKVKRSSLERTRAMRSHPYTDRLFYEQYHRELARYRPDMFEDEDVSLLLLIGMLGIGIVCLMLGTWLLWQRLPFALAQGFTTEIQVKASTLLPWKIHVPTHLLFLLPTILYLLGASAVCSFRRYVRR